MRKIAADSSLDYESCNSLKAPGTPSGLADGPMSPIDGLDELRSKYHFDDSPRLLLVGCTATLSGSVLN